jgi:two-component system, chemotaxis family, protein-glutamate methylesterase/glutaminase
VSAHAWSADTLLAEQSEALEGALWTALRALEEKASLGRRLTQQARQRGYGRAAVSFDEQVRDAEQHAKVVRQVLLDLKPTPLKEDVLKDKVQKTGT